MESIKNSVIKRILIFLCCTIVLILSVFMSYGNTLIVKAVDDADLLKDAAIVCLSGLGIILSGPTAGAVVSILGPEMLALGMDVHDYVTPNEDGTTTISEEFVNLVLQAYKEYTIQNFDGNIHQDESTMYYVYGESEYYLDAGSYLPGHSKYESHISGFTYAYPVAVLLVPGTTQYKYASWGTSSFKPDSKTTGYGCFLFSFNGNPDSSNGGIFSVGRYPSLYGDMPTSILYKDGDEISRGEGFLRQVVSGPSEDDPGYFVSFSSSTVPVYTSFDMMREDFYNGDYSHAENYAISGQTSSYTGTYGGGDIKVTTEKLNGIQEKLDEINETDKSIDDRLKDLLDWLGIGDGIGGGVTGGSWYDQILAYLDKILKQLKSIKRWTIIDTVINGVDAIADWLDLIHDILSDVDDGMESAVATLSSALDDSMGLMKKKFPFSIPWDILFFVTVLSAEPEVPQFSIPFDFEVSALDLEVHYDMELDFTPFQWLSDLSRLLLSMTYAVGLMKMTFNVSNMGKEG